MIKALRHLCLCITSAAGISATPALAAEAPYPAKPIRIIIATTVGSGPDILARQIGAKLTQAWGQQVVIDPRAGASGMIGAELTANATADGYTLWMATMSHVIATTMYQRLLLARDFAPITQVASTPYVIAVNAALPANSIAELIAYAKARPGELNYSSSSVGGATHLAGELFKSMAGVDIVHIPYKGSGAALTDLMAGHIHLAFPPVASVTSHIRSGRLRAIAVTSIKPSAVVPGLPTVAQTLSGYSAGGATSIYAPRGLPAAILGRLNRDIVSLLNKPDTKEKFLGIGIDTVGSSPEELAATMRSELARVGKLIKESGFRLD